MVADENVPIFRDVFNSSSPGRNGHHFADDNFKWIFVNENFVLFWSQFHWSLFLKFQLTITQHWFRKWRGAEQATSHYLNQCRASSLTYICGTRAGWLAYPLAGATFPNLHGTWWNISEHKRNISNILFPTNDDLVYMKYPIVQMPHHHSARAWITKVFSDFKFSVFIFKLCKLPKTTQGHYHVTYIFTMTFRPYFL